jgi:hypothetical protein
VVTGTRPVARGTLRSRDTLLSKDTHLRDTLRSKATRLHLVVTHLHLGRILRSMATLHSSTVTLPSSMATRSKVATPLPVTLAHLRVMVVAMAVVAWAACSLEVQLLRLWLMEHTRFLVVVTVAGTWEADTWEADTWEA